MTDGPWLQVDSCGADVVAAVAADEPARRQARIEPQTAAEQLLLIGVLIAFNDRRFGWDHVEQRLGGHQQAVSSLTIVFLSEDQAAQQQSDHGDYVYG